jgi:hypothetical protein
MKKIGMLKKLYKIFNSLLKLIPVLIEIIEDYRDDGKLNKSNKKVESKSKTKDEELL